MKFAILALVLQSTFAFAGTLNCAGDGLALSESRPDGGAHITPTIQLVVDGEVLVNLRPRVSGNDIQLAAYGFAGNPMKLKESRKGFYTTTYFRQQLAVNDFTVPNPRMYFLGEVVCKSVTYHGPPQPVAGPQ